MVTIGIDSHKSSLSVALVDELGRELAHEEFGNDAGGHRALYGWVVGLAPGERRFGVESTGWIARGLACFLLEQGEQVVDVRGTLTDREDSSFQTNLHLQLAGYSSIRTPTSRATCTQRSPDKNYPLEIFSDLSSTILRRLTTKRP